jgi:hypothetical protein
MKFRGHDILHMITADKDIVVGICPKKEINWHTVREAALAGEENLAKRTGSFVVNLLDGSGSITIPNNQVFEVAAGGTGIMLIKRQVFEKMKKTRAVSSATICRTCRVANLLSSSLPSRSALIRQGGYLVRTIISAIQWRRLEVARFTPHRGARLGTLALTSLRGNLWRQTTMDDNEELRYYTEVQSEEQWVHEMLGTPWAAEVGKDGVMRVIDKDGVLVFKIDSRSPEYAALSAAVIIESVNGA